MYILIFVLCHDTDNKYAILQGYGEVAKQNVYTLYAADSSLPFAYYIETDSVEWDKNPFKNIDSIYSAIIAEKVMVFNEVEYVKKADNYIIQEKKDVTKGGFYAYFMPKTDGSMLHMNDTDYGSLRYSLF